MGGKLGTRSRHPVEHVAYHGPARRLGDRVLAQNPVVVERRDGVVLLFQLDPESQEGRELLVPPGQGIGHGGLEHIGLGDNHRVGRVA